MKKKLRILFDANPLMGNRTGIGHYTARLVSSMADEHPQDIELIGYYYNFLGRKPSPSAPIAANIRYRPVLAFPGPVINMLRRFGIEVPIEVLTLTRADFALYPNFLSHPSLFHVPNAPVIHDLTFRDHPASGSEKNIRDLNRFVPSSIKRSSFIITVSEFSKGRIIQEFAVPASNIMTTFIPPQAPVVIPEAKAQKLIQARGITKPYLFFIGTMEPRKNITALLDAYAALPDHLRNQYSLVLAGKLDWKFQEIKQRLEQLQAADFDIHYLGYVTDEEQAALYQNARLMVLASSYEGFGMQIVEALNYGIPSAVSNIPVFHEVGADRIEYFDQKDPKHIAQVIEKCLEDKKPEIDELRSYLATKPGWSEVARDVVERIKVATGDKN